MGQTSNRRFDEHLHVINAKTNTPVRVAFELRFRSLFDKGRGYSFPCDQAGLVDLDQLSERARCNYLYARAAVGRELSAPVVLTLALH